MFMEVLSWWGSSPWLGLALLLFLATIAHLAVRAVLVLVRGWPPPHIDVDGECVCRDEGDE